MAERIKTVALIQCGVGCALLAVLLAAGLAGNQAWLIIAPAVGLAAAALAWLFAGHRRAPQVAVAGLAVWTVVLALILHHHGEWGAGAGILFALPIVGAAFVLGQVAGALWVAGLTTVLYLGLLVFDPAGGRPAAEVWPGAAISLAGIWGTAAVAWAARTWQHEAEGLRRAGKQAAERAAAAEKRAAELEAEVEDLKARVGRLSPLAAPVVVVHDRILAVPLGGYLDEPRASQVRGALLQAIARHRAKVALIDVTELPDLDAAGAVLLERMIQAGRLVGAEVAVVGIHARLAGSLVASQMELRDLNTCRDLESGIEWALAKTGRRITADG